MGEKMLQMRKVAKKKYLEIICNGSSQSSLLVRGILDIMTIFMELYAHENFNASLIDQGIFDFLKIFRQFISIF